MEKVKIAIIGLGGMGTYHFNKMRELGLFDVVGVYDVDESKKAFCERKGIIFFKSFEDLKAYPGLEAVLIATPNDVHHYYVVEAAKAGLNVVCEKPVTLSSKLLSEMIEEAERNKVVFMVHQNRRWDRDFLCMKKIDEEGKTGKVYKIESKVLGSHGVPGAWRKVKAQGGGMIFDWGVHLIDQLLIYNKSKVTSVFCRTSYVYGFEVDDGFVLMLSFEDGLEATIVIDTNAFQNLPRWVIYGENGTAVIKNWGLRGKIVAVKERLDKKNKGIQAGNGFTKTMANRSNGTVKLYRLPKVKNNQWGAFHENFYKAVRGEAEPVIKGAEVMRVMKVIEAAFESAEKNEVIKTEI